MTPKPKQPKKRNTQDITAINLRSLKARIEKLEAAATGMLASWHGGKLIEKTPLIADFADAMVLEAKKRNRL